MAFFIRVRALREGEREGERKTRVAMSTARDREKASSRAGAELPSGESGWGPFWRSRSHAGTLLPASRACVR